MIYVPLGELYEKMKGMSHLKEGMPTYTPSTFTTSSISKRVRILLEPLLMSLVTTIVIFHTLFGPAAFAPSFTGHQFHHDYHNLDAPASNARPQQVTTLVKRRFPDPPAYDYLSRLPASLMPPIFYHIYVPLTSKGRDNAIRIIEEQLDDFRNNNTKAAPTQKDQPITIFYQTIGDGRAEMEIPMNRLCHDRNMTCHKLGHDDDGREELTLHRVQEYCLSLPEQDNNQRVIYLHNKGSHHKTRLNERWRRQMMRAITHEKCLQPPTDSCNMCSLFTTAERGIFMAGNFWVADCQYIRKLVPPLEFEGHMERVTKDALYLRLQDQLTMDLHRHWPPSFGTGRYAAEFWSGSHPSIVPCDFSGSFQPQPHVTDNTNDFLEWVNKTGDKSLTYKPLQWTMAPKHPIKIAHAGIRTREQWRLKEYFLLAGNVFRWYELYDEVPGESSWVWGWYPDGRKWRNAVRQHGKNALQAMSEEFRSKEHE